MNGETLIQKLKALSNYKIIFTKHAELRLFHRKIDKRVVLNHLKNSDSLKLAEKLQTRKGEEKYKLWFVPYKRTAYIYVIVLVHFKQEIIVKTVIKQKLMWQKKVEKHVKKI